MEQPDYITELAKKWLAGTITSEEKILFDQWYNGFDFSELNMNVPESFQEEFFKEGIRAKIKSQIPQFNHPVKTSYQLWPRLAIATAIAVILFGAGLFFFVDHQNPAQVQMAKANDIPPGKNGATLTLADGQKIVINDALAGNIATQSGVKISKSADGQIAYEITDNPSGSLQYNTLSTTRGQQSQVRLPDGTLVFLNAASSLKYPTSFKTLAKRQVTLVGEGYFEVAKDREHPFVVNTQKQVIEVLGTHFNINAYADENQSQTTLLEGAVKVSGTNNQMYLKPGQMAISYDDERMLSLKQANLESVMAWKNGLFVFNRQQFSDVLKDISRWYNVEFEYSEEIGRRKLWGTISKEGTITELLDNIVITSGIHYKIEGRRIQLTK